MRYAFRCFSAPPFSPSPASVLAHAAACANQRRPTPPQCLPPATAPRRRRRRPPAASPMPTRAAIEDIIKDYLTKEHPEVLMEGMQELQKRDQASAEAKSEAAVKAATDKIFNNPDSPVGGNPKGDVTIVEFFDYQCGYCKMSEPTVEKLLKEDKNVKFIYKDFPILGPASTEAAKRARRQQAGQIHQAARYKLMDAPDPARRHRSAAGRSRSSSRQGCRPRCRKAEERHGRRYDRQDGRSQPRSATISACAAPLCSSSVIMFIRAPCNMTS